MPFNAYHLVEPPVPGLAEGLLSVSDVDPLVPGLEFIDPPVPG